MRRACGYWGWGSSHVGLVPGRGHRHPQMIQGRPATDQRLATSVIRGDHPIRIDEEVQFTLDDPAPRLRVEVRRRAARQVYGILDDLGRNHRLRHGRPFRRCCRCSVHRGPTPRQSHWSPSAAPPYAANLEQGPKAPTNEDLRPLPRGRRPLSHVGSDVRIGTCPHHHGFHRQ